MYADFMFLNPEACLKYDIKTVETTKDFLTAYVFRGGQLSDFHMNRSVIPTGFSGPVFLALTTVSSNVSRLNAVIRSILSNGGLPNSQLDDTSTFVRNINKVATFDGVDSMSLASPISDLAVSINDTLRIEINESDVLITRVVSVDYNNGTIKINPVPPNISHLSTTYVIAGIKVVDSARIGAINYVRGVATIGAFYIPESFNIDLYRTCYPEARLMSVEDAYASYISYNAILKYRVGSVNDLRLVSGIPKVSDTSAFLGDVTITKGLHVNAPVTLNGPVVFRGDVQSMCNMSSSNFRTSNLEVMDATHLRNLLRVSGDTYISSNLEVFGNTEVLGELSSKSLHVSQSLTIDGPSDFKNIASFSNYTQFGSNVDFAENVNVYGETNFQGTVSFNDDIFVRRDAIFDGKVVFNGDTEFVDTNFEKLTVHESMVVPSGPTANRPNSNVGSIRYNTDLMAFEGFTDTAAGWNSLGGLIDTDRDTYVSAEIVPGADDDTLRFYTGGTERMNINGAGPFTFYGSCNVIGCDFDFKGTACFSNVSVSGNISLGSVGDLSTHLTSTTEAITKIASSIDAPYVDDFSIFTIPGTNTIGATISVESAGEYKIYGFASSHDSQPITEPETFKHFHTKQVACGNSNAFYLNTGYGSVTSQATCGILTETFSNIVFDKYFRSLDIVSNNNPHVMGNYKAYRIQFMVENTNGIKVINKRFSNTTPLSEVIRTLDIVPPTIATKTVAAVLPLSSGGGRIEVFVSGINDNGVGSASFDAGFAAFGSPSNTQPPGVECFVLALDRTQTFDDVNEAFAIVDSGCNVTSSISNYNPGALYMESFYTRIGYGIFSNETAMSNYRSYSPHVLVQDKSIPPNRAMFRLPDTTTLDVLSPVFNGTIIPIANHGLTGPHEIEFDVDDIVDDTKTLLYTWLTKSDIISEFETNSQAAAFADSYISALQTTPYEDREFMPVLQYGNVRLTGFYDPDGVYSNRLEDHTNYSVHVVLIDDNSNSTYVKPTQIVTRDTIGPEIISGNLKCFQSIFSPSIEIEPFRIKDNGHDFHAYLFCFPTLPPSTDTIKQRIRDGVYTSSHYIRTNVLGKGLLHDVTLASNILISTGNFPSILPMAHGQAVYPVIFALDFADRSDLLISNGNCVSYDSFHISRNSESSGLKFVIIDAQPPQLTAFTASQGTLIASSTVPVLEAGNPYIRLNYEVSDRHAITSWLYYTSSSNVANEILAFNVSSANKILDPVTYGTLSSAISTDGRMDVTVNNSGQPFDIVTPIIENERYYLFLATRDYHNNAIVYRSTPPYLDITPSNPVVVDITFDVRNNKGDITPSFSTEDYITENGYTSSYLINNLSFLGTGQTLLFSNNMSWPLTISLETPRSFVKKYVLKSGSKSNAPTEWTLTLLDEDDMQLYTDTRTGQSFNDNETREFTISPVSGVSKAILSLPVKNGDISLSMFRLFGVNNSDSSLANTLDITYTATDRGRTGLSNVYLYYSADDKGFLTPEDVKNNAITFTNISHGSREGGKTWVCSSLYTDSQRFVSRVLPQTTQLFLYMVATDAANNFSTVVRDTLLSAKTFHSGLTYDTTEPVMVSLTSVLKPRNDVTQTNVMEIDFQASDLGGANISYMYVYYSHENLELSWSEVKRLAESTVPGTTSGGFVIDKRTTNTNAVSSGTLVSTNLQEWTKFWVYSTCEDSDGNFSKEIGGKSHKTEMSGNLNGSAGNRTWDYSQPIGQTRISMDIQNRLYFDIDASDTGNINNSGIVAVYLHYSESNVNYSPDQTKALALSTVETSNGGGKIWDFTPTYQDTITVNHVSGILKEYSAFYSYVTIEDIQGNLSSTIKSAIPIHGGLTYDLTNPVVTVTDPVFVFPDTDIRNYRINVGFTVNNPSVGGSPFLKTFLYYTDTPGQYDATHVRLSTDNGGRFGSSNTDLTSGTFSLSGSDISGMNPYVPWYFYITAFDKDTEIVRSIKNSHSPDVEMRIIPSSINGGKSYDLNPPQMSLRV